LDKICVPALIAETKEPLKPREFAPVVPTVNEWIRATAVDLPADYAGTYLSPSGLRYSERSGKLYVPKLLRESLLWWFHTSRYGGHAGVNRTARRMRNWVWWPQLTRDVSQYVGSCIYCLRRTPPRVKTIKGALTRPGLFDLVSVDYVGPRTVNGIDYHILVLVDHASRFVMAKVTTKTSAVHVRECLEEQWCAVFQTPAAVLSDRGSEFRSAYFHDFVTQVLGAFHIFSSAYYPQGNAVNESSHRALEISVNAYLRDSNDIYSAVRDAVRVYNATPHSATGVSPHYFLFGVEAVFPGWQQFNPKSPGVQRHRIERNLREASSGEPISVGDWVVYPYSDVESKVASHPIVTSEKYRPVMSLPSKVIEVRGNSLTVQILGCPRSKRDVSASVCRKITSDLPPTLQPLALNMIDFEAPRLPRFINVRKELDPKNKMTWESLVENPVSARAGESTLIPRFDESTSSCAPPNGETVC
jgi:transposase InsO family protein